MLRFRGEPGSVGSPRGHRARAPRRPAGRVGAVMVCVALPSIPVSMPGEEIGAADGPLLRHLGALEIPTAICPVSAARPTASQSRTAIIRSNVRAARTGDRRAEAAGASPTGVPSAPPATSCEFRPDGRVDTPILARRSGAGGEFRPAGADPPKAGEVRLTNESGRPEWAHGVIGGGSTSGRLAPWGAIRVDRPCRRRGTRHPMAPDGRPCTQRLRRTACVCI